MYVNKFAGIAATVALFIPVLLIIAARLFRNGSLLALLFYYLVHALYSLGILKIIVPPASISQNAAFVINYLDAPLMLLVLLFFCNHAWQRKLVHWTLLLFIIFEIVVGFFFGLQFRSSLYLLGPGTLLILGFSVYFFSNYGKLAVVQGKGIGKTFMLASMIFMYGCFLIIYYLHYLKRTPAVADVFLIYYIVMFISAVIMSVGLIWIIRRTCEIKEVQTTRKELALFFKQ